MSLFERVTPFTAALFLLAAHAQTPVDPNGAPLQDAGVLILAQSDDEQTLPPLPKNTQFVSASSQFVRESEPHTPGTWRVPFQSAQLVRVSATRDGLIGLHRVASADFGRKGLLRFVALFEHASLTRFLVAQNHLTRLGANFAVSYVPVDFGEIALSYQNIATQSSIRDTTLKHAQGDFLLSGRVAMKLNKLLRIGAGVEFSLLSSPRTLETSAFAFGISPNVFATFDVPKLKTIRVHLNVSAHFDDSGKFVPSRDVFDTFAFRSSRYSNVTTRLGVEWALPWATPFLEYALRVPLGSNFTLANGTAATTLQASQNLVGVGAKLTVFDDVTIFSVVEAGLFRNAVLGIPAQMPYNFLLGISYTSDPFHRYGVRLIDRLVERQRPTERPTGDLRGTVRDAQTERPVPFAIISCLKGSPLASDGKTGRFLSQPLMPGKHKILVQKEGYVPFETVAEIRSGASTELSVLLTPLPKVARLTVHVYFKNKPIAATVRISGATEKTFSHEKDSKEGAFSEVPAGLLSVDIAAEGYLSQTKELATNDKDSIVLQFEMSPQPAKSLVVVNETKIEILQKIFFAFNKATIQRRSFALLDEVVSAIVSKRISLIRVEGHTDNFGDANYNLKLSQERAEAVKQHLIKRGVSPNRLTAQGFGQAAPIADNSSARGREKNRRVEFMIVKETLPLAE